MMPDRSGFVDGGTSMFKLIASAVVLAVVAAAGIVEAAEAPGADEIAVPRRVMSMPLVPEALAAEADEAPYCVNRKHIGRRGYLVDQAWQFYRELEKTAPLRVGWCNCAKRCEPIDRYAAKIEAQAFLAKDASVDPKVRPKLRNKYAKRSSELFAQRNETVNTFRSCLDETRPPISMASQSYPVTEKKLEGCVDNLSLKADWALWCAEYKEAWDAIYADFKAAYKDQKKGNYYLTFWIRATPDGKLTRASEAKFSISKKAAVSYIDRITGIKMRPFPEGSQLSEHTWSTVMQVVTKSEERGTILSRDMDCPTEDDPT
jgi:hypothetical protein